MIRAISCNTVINNTIFIVSPADFSCNNADVLYVAEGVYFYYVGRVSPRRKYLEYIKYGGSEVTA